MITVDSQLLNQLTEKAKASPRLRMNHNFHPANESACHRLLNAIEPGSYIRPHCHLDPEKDESFVLLRGQLGVICFDANGAVSEKALLIAGSDQAVITIPHGVFHTAVSLSPGTIFFEAKAGPYIPFSEAEVAPWAPLDTDPASPAYLQQLCALFNSH
ncbi:cupin fold metalloprotein, WbuC family [Trichlorobacter thiogenes]|uniref:Cupin fold metalloprotein, WbuC family n=1 Tax=Trichlorobacter thiogenes TaxID=115783 RepID=A0A1T4JRJ9_9BACT|nr:WbuC family cupin fold metalloprotein [Trichlorobacter thiogenes]SJZ32781.1 cupin fold metalloprotein, WbuC family [Trichlorobacter thiogenes]